MSTFDLSTALSMSFYVRDMKLKELLNRYNVKYSVIINLLQIDYLNKTRGKCYDIDMAIMNEKPSRIGFKAMRINLYYMRRGKFIGYEKIKEDDPILGRSYIVRDRGRRLLDEYTAAIHSADHEVSYKIKLKHKEAREAKKNK